MDLIKDRLDKLSEAASQSKPVYRARMVAAIYLRNKLITLGHNSYKTHPFQARFGKMRECIYLHAETDAIKNALKHIDVVELRKASLYVARVKLQGSKSKVHIQGLARPCEGCQRAIATFGIEEVFYTLDDDGYDML